MPKVMIRRTNKFNRYDAIIANLRSLVGSFMDAHAHPESGPTGSLTLAVIAASPTPLLLLDANLKIIAASRSFCSAFQIALGDVLGRRFVELGVAQSNARQLASMLRDAARGHAEVKDCEFEFGRAGREKRIFVANAHMLDHGDVGKVRLILAASDVTDARNAERLNHDLLQEKAVLLQELQHRVANSLQIIASVLMQSARNTLSEEARSHLHDAHHRVMSIVAVQKHLVVSSNGDVELRSYFSDLCRSIATAMIQNCNQLSLEVRSDEIRVSSSVSVSLGLIITELVINALKHAFPGDQCGKIVVDYRSSGGMWSLSVSDNGIGMSRESAASGAGLGTGIVRALARQLQAEIRISDAKPGTSVCIFRPQAAVGDGAKGNSLAGVA